MPITLAGYNFALNSDTLGALSAHNVPSVASVGAGQANTAVLTSASVPFQYKIRYLTILVTAIDNVTGTDSFNLVVGGLAGQTGQAYTQGNTAANDNSGPAGPSYGYPTNVAVAGNCVFANDVPFNSANLAANNVPANYYASASPYNPGVTTWVPSSNLIGQSLPGTGWYSLATTGGYGLFVPTNFDAVYPAVIPLSLRATTVASTGSISNMAIVLGIVPVRKRAQPVPGEPYPLLVSDY
jgi:hypothetical protein